MSVTLVFCVRAFLGGGISLCPFCYPSPNTHMHTISGFFLTPLTFGGGSEQLVFFPVPYTLPSACVYTLVPPCVSVESLLCARYRARGPGGLGEISPQALWTLSSCNSLHAFNLGSYHPRLGFRQHFPNLANHFQPSVFQPQSSLRKRQN